MSNLDITFCDSDCKNKECERNKSRIPNGFCVSVADFSKDCENYKRMTNGDKIRSMSDEELNQKLIDAWHSGYKHAKLKLYGNIEVSYMEWLKSEVE